MIKNKILSNTIIFTLSSIISKGINFLLLPILTHYLTKDDYGYLGFIVSVISISTIYVGLFPQNFLIAKYVTYKREKIAKYMSNIFIIIFFTYLILLLVMFFTKNSIFHIFEDSYIIFYISLYTLFMVIFNILNIMLQIEKNALKYAFFQFSFVFFSISLALYFIIISGYDWHGKFYAELIILFFLAIYTIYYLFKNNYFKFDFDIYKIKELFLYLFPLTFSVISLYLISTIDKIILAKYLPLEIVGLYTIAMTMSVIINIIYDSILKAWNPYFFEKISTKSKEDISFIKKSLIFYSIFVVLTTLLYILIVPYIFDIMIDSKFLNSLKLIPYIVVAFMFEGLRKPWMSFLMHINKLNKLAFYSILIAIINILLNIFLIPIFGVFGAIYATIFAFFGLFIINIFLVFKECLIFKT